ncbi:MAG: hypothetical protein Kapaf2KO_19460 [Candidatus Kapaibacteriales bacterium]
MNNKGNTLVDRNHLIRLLPILVLFFTFLGLESYSQVNQPGYRYGAEKLLDARSRFDNGLLKQSERELQDLFSNFPGNIALEKALLLEVDIDLAKGNYNIADTKLGEFIKQYPNSPFVSLSAYKRGVLSFERNRFLEASEYFNTAKQIAQSDYEFRRQDPVYEEIAGKALFWEAVSLSRISEFDRAYPLFESVMDRYPNSDYADDALYSLGKIDEMREEFQPAIDRFKKLRITYPNSNTFIASLIREANNNITLRNYENATLNLEKADAVLTSIEKQDTIGLKYPKQTNAEFARQEILYLRGEAANMAGNFEKAESYFTAFLETFENDELTDYSRLGLGWALLNQDKPQEAVELYDKVIFSTDKGEKKSLQDIAKLYRAIALGGAGNKEQSRRELSALAVKAGYPYQGQVLLELAQMQYEEEDYQEARKTLERAENELIDSESRVRIKLLLGAVYMHLKMYEKAIDVYKDAETIAENSIYYKMPKKDWYIKESRLKQGISQVMIGKNARAISDLSSYIAVAGNDPRASEAIFWLSEAYFQSNAYKNAIQSFNTLLDKYPETNRREDALYAIGWSQFMLQDFRASGKTFDRLIGEYPQTKYGTEVMTRQGDGYYLVKQYNPAAGAYKKAAELGAGTELGEYASYQLANSLFKLGAYDQSITALNQFAAKYRSSPFAPNALYLIGWVKFQKKDYRDAIDSYRYLIEAFPRSEYVPRAHYSIADAFYNNREYERATEKYQFVIDYFPESDLAPEALRGIQQSLTLLGREDEAIEVINTYTANNKTSPFVRDFKEKKAGIFFNNGRYKDAVAEYENLIEEGGSPEQNAEAMYWMGKSYIEMGQPREAEAAFLRLMEKYPESDYAPMGLIENALLWQDMANLPKADSLFTRIIDKYPENPISGQAGFEKAIIRYSQRDTVEALRLYELVAERFPNNEYGVNSRYRLGMFARSKNQNDSARYHFAKLAENEYDAVFAAEATYRIGELLLKDKYYDEAIEALEKSKNEFASYEDWFSLALLNQGEAYEKKEMYNEALQDYRSLKELRPEDDFGATAKTRIARIEKLQGEGN